MAFRIASSPFTHNRQTTRQIMIQVMLTALLLALSLPPLGPWWMIVLATAFAIIISKPL